ncbi:MAG: [FeFe] hydrogenase H-cluster radical SAM maturase HydE [Bacteroidales bacterium]|nr:[FeFe] hydrogenase H-cluster radical SAM maturase HydE [Bacteroidales bacterium]
METKSLENLKALADRLHETGGLTKQEWVSLISARFPGAQDDGGQELSEYVFSLAREERQRYYGKDVYVRGLIEFTNYCKNDCLYCGIRRSNRNARRYRLGDDEILACCREGYDLGFRTFVLQGGEDPYYTDDRLVPLVRRIRSEFPDCAITLSLGERSFESYAALFDAGADRYLLRHETAGEEHYGRLHPPGMTAANRQHCLWELKDIGYQVGAGFMVGSPYQTPEDLAEDFLFLKELDPQMIGIGPFIPHHDTPFAGEPAGSLELTLFLLGLLRLMLPKVLLPATTALGTIHPEGRELGILAGANVVMPNLSPTEVRKDYLLYDNKICTGDESAQCRSCLEQRMEAIGYHVVTARGDSLNI